MISIAIEFLGAKPVVGLVTSILGLIASCITQEAQDLILFALQAMALVVSILVGMLTIIGWIQKRKKN